MRRASKSQVGRYCWLAALVAYLGCHLFFGEKVPYKGGLGFDGELYGILAQNFPAKLAQGVPQYYLDRILPSVIIWLAAKALGMSLATAGQVVVAFRIYNSLLLVGAAALWVRLSRSLKLRGEVAMIGAAAMFCNWTVLKQFQYFAVQTDATALAAGVLVSLCVIEQRHLLLIIAAALTSFAFKLVMPFAAVLVLFSTPPRQPVPNAFFSERWLPAAAAGAAMAIVLYAIFVERIQFNAGAAPIAFAALPLSLFITCIYVYHVARSAPVATILRSLRLGPLTPIGVFLTMWGLRAAVLALLVRLYANDIDIIDFKFFFLASLALSVAKPAVFLIAQVAVFGPAFILAIWYLPRILAAAVNCSVGTGLFLIALLALSLDPESRAITFAYPMLVTFLCLALQQLQVSRTFTIIFVAASLVLSRFYLPLNALGMAAIGSGPITDFRLLRQFPWQWIMMNIGPWMSWPGYAANAALAALAAALLLALRPVKAVPEGD